MFIFSFEIKPVEQTIYIFHFQSNKVKNREKYTKALNKAENGALHLFH